LRNGRFCIESAGQPGDEVEPQFDRFVQFDRQVEGCHGCQLKCLFVTQCLWGFTLVGTQVSIENGGGNGDSFAMQMEGINDDETPIDHGLAYVGCDDGVGVGSILVGGGCATVAGERIFLFAEGGDLCEGFGGCYAVGVVVVIHHFLIFVVHFDGLCCLVLCVVIDCYVGVGMNNNVMDQVFANILSLAFLYNAMIMLLI